MTKRYSTCLVQCHDTGERDDEMYECNFSNCVRNVEREKFLGIKKEFDDKFKELKCLNCPTSLLK